jgi:hypothetical protein
MNSTGYKILGFATWHGAKWYLRQRLPSARRVLLLGATATTGLIGAGIIAKRLTS